MTDKFRVYFDYAFETDIEPFYSDEFDSLEMANAVLNALAIYTLVIQEHELMADYSNFTIVEKFEDGEWLEVDEDDYK